MISLKGKFIKYIYQNVENNFAVAIFKLDKEYQEDSSNDFYSIGNITVSIKNIDISINKIYKIQVTESKSNKYKDSFELISIEKNIIDSKSSAIDYLSSKKFVGITKATATKIINELGIEFLKSPEDFETKLQKIISVKKTLILIEQVNIDKIYQQVLDKFNEHNLSIRILYLIEKEYKDQQLINFLENDVYSILELHENINFFDVDNIAEIFLTNFSNKIRMEKYIAWSIDNLSFSTGSTIFQIKELYFSINRNFGMSKDEFFEAIKELAIKKLIVLSKNKQSITSIKIYEKEEYIAKRLKEINQIEINKFSNKIINDNIDEIQNNALEYSLNNSITIISGYPGTGKTTLVDKIVKNLTKEEPGSFNLLAPTGKAAYQIFLKTGHTARTIHSFLGMQKGTNIFRINEENPSLVKTLIIDEFSMINIDLFYSLLIGCPNLKRLILIGDKNQLPSIGAGYLLNDIIASNKFKTFLLQKIYRQELGSSIIDIALVINDQKMPVFNNKESIFIEEEEWKAKDKILEKVDYFIEQKISNYDYQILVPMYSGECGIDKLNILIQKKYSKDKQKIDIRNQPFYLGDKVIQIENNNEVNVFNGEIGYIIEFNGGIKISEIVIQFEDGKIIKYTLSNFIKNIKLAYAISIHKFQGSECKNIVLVIYNSHYALLSKKLLYTAVTRASENLIIFGEQKAIKACIYNDNDSKRLGNILQFLIE